MVHRTEADEMGYEYSTTSNRVVRSEIREILKLTRRPGIISFAGGLPDASLFPIEQITEITAKMLSDKGYVALQYGPTDGEKEFKDAMIAFGAEHGEEVTHEQLTVTSSSQQGLDLLSMLLIDPGSPVILELPSYLGGIQAYRRCGADMRGVRMDDEGLIIDELLACIEKIESEGKKPRFINLIPDYQNPSGITMTVERRKQVIEIGRQKDILIIEDSPYREIVFDGEKLPSLWTLSGGKGVVTLKTLSKMLFPGMRIGWMYGDEEVIDKVIGLKQSVDLCTPSFNQLIVAEYFRSGRMAASLQAAIDTYRPKARAMLEAMDAHFPDGVRWSRPAGGMFLWVVLPEHMDAKEIFMEAIEEKVAYIIGRPFHCDGSGTNTLRLNYSFPSIEQIGEGIERLGRVIGARL
jgi:2-aminoadipate transaminase